MAVPASMAGDPDSRRKSLAAGLASSGFAAMLPNVPAGSEVTGWYSLGVFPQMSLNSTCGEASGSTYTPPPPLAEFAVMTLLTNTSS